MKATGLNDIVIDQFFNHSQLLEPKTEIFEVKYVLLSVL